MKNICYLLLISLVVLSSCEIGQNQLRNEYVVATKYPESTFNELSTCQKINIILEVSYDHIDRDHSVLLIPKWMTTDFIKEVDITEFNSCASRIYSSIAGSKGKLHQKEKIEALLYLLFEFYIQRDQENATIINNAICVDKYIDDSGLLDIYYYIKFNTFPDMNSPKENWINKLCSN